MRRLIPSPGPWYNQTEIRPALEAGTISGDRMRLFIAIPLGAQVKGAAKRAQDAFRRARVGGNYVPAENLHLTLAFLGELPDAREAVEAAAEVSFAPFTLTAQGLGRFDDIWWLGFRESEALSGLARSLRRELASRGVPFDRKRFRPHVTLLRRADGAPNALPDVDGAETLVDRFCLYRSTRSRNGMIYTELASFDAGEHA